MTPFRCLLYAAMLVLPTLGWGYAYTAMTGDGSFKQNQATGRPIIWNVPQQAFALDFGAGYDASAEAAMAEWNGVNTPLTYQLGTTGAEACAEDGYNSAGWGTHTCGNQPFGDAIAVTKRSYVNISGNWYLREADIVLDSSRRWEIYSGNLRAGIPEFHRVILHELGHALGLDHPDDAGQRVTAIMNSRTSDIDRLQIDDRKGISALYLTGASDSANQISGTGGSDAGGGGAAGMVLLGLLAWILGRESSPSRPRGAGLNRSGEGAQWG